MPAMKLRRGHSEFQRVNSRHPSQTLVAWRTSDQRNHAARYDPTAFRLKRLRIGCMFGSLAIARTQSTKLAGALSRGNIGIIPRTAETENTRSHQGGVWLMNQSAANPSQGGISLLFRKMQGEFEKMQRGVNCNRAKATISQWFAWPLPTQ